MLGSTVAATAAALLSAMPAVYAGHRAIVKNYCDFDVYLWAVDADRDPQYPTTVGANGGMYAEKFHTPAFGGVSLKLSPESNLKSVGITQLEYTWLSELWYDVSNVNCHEDECPFQPHGLYMHSGEGCPTVSCIPGNLTCGGAYTLWNDDWASLCCTESKPDVFMYLCSEGPEPPANPQPYKPKKHKPKKHKPSPPSYSPEIDLKIAPAEVTTKHKPKKHKPTPVEPATEWVEVTEVATVVVTVTPGAKPKREAEEAHEQHARHIHNHAHAHGHRHF